MCSISDSIINDLIIGAGWWLVKFYLWICKIDFNFCCNKKLSYFYCL